MSLFSPGHPKCDGRRFDYYATVVTPDGLACDHHCPDEHWPRRPRNPMAEVERILQEAMPSA